MKKLNENGNNLKVLVRMTLVFWPKNWLKISQPSFMLQHFRNGVPDPYCGRRSRIQEIKNRNKTGSWRELEQKVRIFKNIKHFDVFLKFIMIYYYNCETVNWIFFFFYSLDLDPEPNGTWIGPTGSGSGSTLKCMRILKRTQKTLPAVLLAAACSQRSAFLLRCQPEKRQDV